MTVKHFGLLRSVFFTALVAAAAAANAQTNNLYRGPEFGYVPLNEVLTAAAQITQAKYPDCDDATVERNMVRVYHADGTAECQDEGFTKVLTEKGKRNNRTLAMGFMLPYTTVQVVKLEVIRPGGQVVPVDVAANSKVTIDDSQMAMNIYDPNVKVLQVNIPQLEIGDIVHSVTRTTIERPIIPGQYSEESVFEGPSYIRHMTYEVYAPAERPLVRIALRDEVPGTVKYASSHGPDQTVVHRWEISNVPRMFDEPAMPPYEMTLQRLFVSTTPDWLAVSKWYWNLSKPHLEATSPELKQQVEELTQGASTDMAKIKALFYYVSKKVRYMGLTPEKDRPGFEPHDVKITFMKQYGVCRDKAALLVSMLRAAGLRAYPVLINVGTHKDKEVPDPDFNHAIVSVELKPRQYVLMDPTDENTRDLLPSGDCDQSYLVCRPEGETIQLSPIQPPVDNRMTLETAGTLSAAGRLVAHTEMDCAGVNDDIYRNMLVHLKPDDQRRFFERHLKQVLPGARLESLRVFPENMLDVSVPVRVEMQYSVPDVAALGDGKSVVSLPWLGNRLGVLKYLLSNAGLEKRKYPMQTFVTYDLKEHLSLKTGEGLGQALALPSCSPVDDEGVSYHQSCTLKDGTLDCSRELQMKVVEFSPAQYLRLKQTLKLLDYDERKEPILADSDPQAAKPSAYASSSDGPIASDAKILESRKQLQVTDAHTAVYTVKYAKKILDYAGKIREAEIKIDYNPACQEATLLRGVVISKAGKRQEISKQEINVMDAGWNASAKRYTGGKVLVANLPGVDIGSTIEVEFQVRSKNKPFLAGFEPFQFPDELAQKSFKLTAPEDLQVEQTLTGPTNLVEQQKLKEPGKQGFEWTAENVKALPAESQLPPEWAYSAGVEYFVGDLHAYLQELNSTMLERSSKSVKAGKVALELTGAAKTKLEAVTAIRDFVAKSIREAGPSFTELPLSELSAADTTLADGYGHAADRAILLHAMLTAAGFRPEFVLGSSLPPISGITNLASTFPLPHYFTSPVVRVAVDGASYYLNDTDQYARLGSTSHDGDLGLVLGTQNCEVLRAAPGCEQKTETDYAMSLDDSGKMRLGVTKLFYGPDYNRRNRYFSELPPEEKRRYFQEIVSGISQGAQPLSDLVTKFDTYPGLEQFSVEVNNYAVVDGKYYYFDLPFTPSLFPAGADERTLPLFISERLKNRIRAEIDLPPGFRHLVMAPRKQNLFTAGGQAQVVTTTEAGKCTIEDNLELTPAIVPPKNYGEMLAAEATLGAKASRLFLLERVIAP